jgi:membrane protein YdbS with pleckstrin-like domain
MTKLSLVSREQVDARNLHLRLICIVFLVALILINLVFLLMGAKWQEHVCATMGIIIMAGGWVTTIFVVHKRWPGYYRSVVRRERKEDEHDRRKQLRKLVQA